MKQNEAMYELDLQITPSKDCVYVHSDDVPGLNVCGPNFKSMKPKVELAIKRLFLDNRGIDVRVVWVHNVSVLKKKGGAPTSVPTRIAIYKAA